ncbi:MAG: DUF2892 domain-containing protein [Gemmatimonadota bacterium]
MSIAESFGRTGYAQFVNNPAGRLARIIVGAGLIAWGYVVGETGTGITLMVIGLVPLAAGIMDWCLISALLGGPLSGSRIRKPQT